MSLEFRSSARGFSNFLPEGVFERPDCSVTAFKLIYTYHHAVPCHLMHQLIRTASDKSKHSNDFATHDSSGDNRVRKSIIYDLIEELAQFLLSQSIACYHMHHWTTAIPLKLSQEYYLRTFNEPDVNKSTQKQQQCFLRHTYGAIIVA